MDLIRVTEFRMAKAIQAERLKGCNSIPAEKLMLPTKLPAPVRRQIARVAGIGFFSGAIFGVLLIVGLAWLAWVLGV